MLQICSILFLTIFCHFSMLAAENCESRQKESRCLSIFEDLSNCFNSTYSPMISDCLVTCNACDSYNCQNPQSDFVLNCTKLVNQCESHRFREFMKEKCPATCGKCNRKNANLCNDKSSSDVCSTMGSFCNTIDYYDLLSTECPSTCNRCPLNGTNFPENQECVDVANDCFSNKYKCNNVNYSSLMHRLCPKTCNSCGVCEDFNKMCSQWKSLGFCTKYNREIVFNKCPKSCGLCN